MRGGGSQTLSDRLEHGVHNPQLWARKSTAEICGLALPCGAGPALWGWP